MLMPRPPLLAALALCLSCANETLPREAGDMAAPPADLAPALGPDEIPLKVHRRCPGDPGCGARGDGLLRAGVARVDITPLVEPFTDMNGNKVWDPGEPFEDKDGNGRFDAYWIAGFGTGRLATGVHDKVWARALALTHNETAVVLVAVDTLGLFRDETIEIEKLLPAGHGIDLLMVHATHCHETADLAGAWGRSPVENGINAAYQARVRRAVADAAMEALRTARPARVTFGSIPVEDGPAREMRRYVSDSRDPVVIDNVLHTMLFSDNQAPHAPIATLINWAHHPESVGSANQLISSDFVHYLRERVEQRGGGTVVYVSGALGGQIGPGRVEPLGEDMQPVRERGFKKAEAIGYSVARFALTAMADPAATTLPAERVPLSFRSTILNVQVHNTRFHLASMLKIYQRAFCCYDMTRPIDEENLPWIETHIAYLRLGPASIITNPGELHPELFVGGYDGSRAGTYPFIDRGKANAPDLEKAPAPPYLIDIMDGERAHRQTFGLTLDFLGYIVPRFNFVLDERSPYFAEAEGDHYEETNSIGPLAEPQIVGTMRQLILDGRDNVAR